MITKILPNSLINLVNRTFDKLDGVPNGFIAIFARIGAAGVFWKSAMTKIAFDTEVGNGIWEQFTNVLSFNWQIADSTFFLFQYEYDLPLLPYKLATILGTATELIAPVLLILGLASRFAAATLLVMVATIQFLVYPNLWLDHALWAAALLFILCRGPGLLSLDRLVGNRH